MVPCSYQAALRPLTWVLIKAMLLPVPLMAEGLRAWHQPLLKLKQVTHMSPPQLSSKALLTIAVTINRESKISVH